MNATIVCVLFVCVMATTALGVGCDIEEITINQAGSTSGGGSGCLPTDPPGENCVSPEDDDCDGVTETCTGDTEWSAGYGKAGNGSYGRGLVVDKSNNIFLLGDIGGSTVNLGGSDLETEPGSIGNFFLAKLDPSGAHQWSKPFAWGTENYATDIAMDPDGNLLVSGSSNAILSPQCVPGSPLDRLTPYVAKLDASGNCIWGMALLSDTPGAKNRALGIASDSDGNAFVVGEFGVNIICGLDEVTTDVTNGLDIFVAKVSKEDGSCLWIRSWGGSKKQSARRVAVGTDGLFIGGNFDGDVPFGSDTLSTDIENGFVAKIGLDGAAVWGKQVGDGSHLSELNGISLTPDGTVVASGYESADNGASSLVVYRWSSSGVGAAVGNLPTMWSSAHTEGRAVSDPWGNIVVAGITYSDLALDCPDHDTLTSLGGPATPDLFVVKYSPGGQCVWSRVVNEVNFQSVYNVVADHSGSLIMTGTYLGTPDFGDGALPLIGDQMPSNIDSGSVFLAKLAP